MPEAAAQAVVIGVTGRFRWRAVARRQRRICGRRSGKTQRVLTERGEKRAIRRCGNRRRRPNQTETQREQRQGGAKSPAGSPEPTLVHQR
jgi:hypothetical protein